MASSDPSVPKAVGRRIARWAYFFYTRARAQARTPEESRFPTKDAYASFLGLKPPTVSNILNGKRRAGFDVLLKLREKFKDVTIDEMIDFDPPNWQTPMGWAEPELDGRAEPPSPPGAAPPAQAERQRRTGHR